MVADEAKRMHGNIDSNEAQIRVNVNDLVSRFKLVPFCHLGHLGDLLRIALTSEHLSKIIHTSPKISYVALLISVMALRP